MLDKNGIIKKFSMIKHPEGGYFAQTYRSSTVLNGRYINLENSEYRPISTSIYFMLYDKEVSHFHRLKSDEIWYYHGGVSLTIAIIDEDGLLTKHKLGLDIENGEQPQIIVPGGTIFGSYIESGNGCSLVGCMVSFGFDFVDFELFERESLLSLYPQHKEIIEKLTL